MINKFYTKEEVEIFLDKFDFIYKIPDLPEDFYYVVALDIETKTKVDYAKIQRDTGYIWDIAGRYFYNTREMQIKRFGVTYDLFEIDKKKEKEVNARKNKIIN